MYSLKCSDLYRNLRLSLFGFKHGVLWERVDLSDADFENWYEWMHSSNNATIPVIQEYFLKWKSEIQTVIEVGSGVGYFWPDWLISNFEPDHIFLVEPSKRATAISKIRHLGLMSRISHFAIGIGDLDRGVTADLVFSIRSIDMSGNIDGFLKKCLRHSRKFVYVTFTNDAVQGSDHVYRWDPRGYYWSAASITHLSDLCRKFEFWEYEIRQINNPNNPGGEIHLALWRKV